ncbi:hypothetical protein Tco_0303944 [Tanacetum coccineum]
MAERTMEELLQAPTKGYGEAIVIPEINADHFEIKTNLLQLDSLNAAAGGNLLKKVLLRRRGNERIDKLADQISTLVEIVSKKVVAPATVKAVEEICVTCGGAHAYYNCPNTDSNQSSVCVATGIYNQVAPPNRVSNHMAPHGFAPMQNNSQIVDFFKTMPNFRWYSSGNTIPTPKGKIKDNHNLIGVAYEGPSIPTNPSHKKVVERETEETTDKEQTNFQGSTAHIQPPVIPIPILEPDVLRTLPKPNIPYPSRLNQEKLREKSNAQMMKFLEIFQKIHFDMSFADALLYMPKFAPMFRSLISNKEKLFELSSAPLNENCSAVLLKKLPEKLGDPGKFLIPCDFPDGNARLGQS